MKIFSSNVVEDIADFSLYSINLSQKYFHFITTTKATKYRNEDEK
jgi:hypothetical protein